VAIDEGIMVLSFGVEVSYIVMTYISCLLILFCHAVTGDALWMLRRSVAVVDQP
jgi:hypothetical protein